VVTSNWVVLTASLCACVSFSDDGVETADTAYALALAFTNVQDDDAESTSTHHFYCTTTTAITTVLTVVLGGGVA